MDKVGGLRSVQSDRPQQRMLRGTSYKPAQQGSVALNPVATVVDRYAAPPVAPQDERLGQLANALSNLNPALQRYSAAKVENQMRDQAERLPAYIEQFKKDWDGGLVTAAQVRERFPETVPVIASRIAQAMGSEAGKRRIEETVNEVMTNDQLRLNTQERQAYLEEARGKIFAEFGEGNDFFNAGAMEAVNKAFATHELNWQRETAAHHQEVQRKAFAEEVLENFRAGKDLTSVDLSWKHGSSLINEERNAIVVDTIAKEAFDNDAPEYLDLIPNRFLNRETKLLISDMKDKIEAKRMSTLRNAIYMQNIEREERTRGLKQDILAKKALGENVDPTDFVHDPEAFDYALRVLDAPMIPGHESAFTANTIRSEILKAASTGDYGPLMGDSAFTENNLREAILDHPGLNADDKQRLMGEIPKLMEGVNLMKDDYVTSPLNTVINPALTVLENSVKGALFQFNGFSPRASVMEAYHAEIRNEFMKTYKETGEWPRGEASRVIVERATKNAIEAVKVWSQLVPGEQEKPSNAKAETTEQELTRPLQRPRSQINRRNQQESSE